MDPNDNSAMWMFITRCMFKGGILGIAPIGGSCSSPYAAATNTWLPAATVASSNPSVGISRVFAHEMGHALGSIHDENLPKSLMYPRINTEFMFSKTPSIEGICQNIDKLMGTNKYLSASMLSDNCFSEGDAFANGGMVSLTPPSADAAGEDRNNDAGCEMYLTQRDDRPSAGSGAPVTGCEKLINWYAFINLCVFDRTGQVEGVHECRQFDNEVLCYVAGTTNVDTEYVRNCGTRRMLSSPVVPAVDSYNSTQTGSTKDLMAQGRMLFDTWVDY